jgi:hypothetical protein
MNLSDYQPTEALMYLLKGESGTGKSIALGSFPGPLYIASCDGRVAPLAHYPGIKDRKDLEFDIYTSYNKLVDKLEKLTQDCPYKTVAVDPLTGLARLAIAHLFSNRGTPDPKKDKEPRSVGGIPIMGINEYNGESSAIASMLLYLRIIRNKGVNTVLTAHVVTSEMKTLDNKYITTRRLLTGGNKIAAEIPSYFDEVYHFYSTAAGLSNDKSYRALTYNVGEDFARTSFYGLQGEIDFTDKLFYDELMQAVKISKGEVTL